MSKFGKYIENSYNELLHKVTWPSWPELQQSTIITLVGFAIIVTLLLGMDTVSRLVSEAFYGLKK